MSGMSGIMYVKKGLRGEFLNYDSDRMKGDRTRKVVFRKAVSAPFVISKMLALVVSF
jgi:hypothetical protein